MKQFDWPALIRLGFQVMRLTPEAFWQLTPGEFRLMLSEQTQGGPMTRSGLQNLMNSYPDTIRKDANDDR
ncbi:MAG: rcc01693 family protein [Pseudomonadota bacterium]